jgi:uncharacterized membrane protein YhaH (DUF805 family)
MDYQSLLLSAQGRISRKSYWIGAVIIAVVDFVLYLLIFLTHEHLGFISIILSLFFLVLAYAGICLGIKRFHDRDKSGWWVLIALIPLIGAIWYLVEVGFLPGTPGPNKFGADSLAV